MIKFFKRTWADYSAIAEKDPNGIYFITDKGLLLQNEIEFGRDQVIFGVVPEFAAAKVGVLYVDSANTGKMVIKQTGKQAFTKVSYRYKSTFTAEDIDNESVFTTAAVSGFVDSKISGKLDDVAAEKAGEVIVAKADGKVEVSGVKIGGAEFEVSALSTTIATEAAAKKYADEIAAQAISIKGQDAIIVTGDTTEKTISLALDGNDKVLSQTSGGLLANISLVKKSSGVASGNASEYYLAGLNGQQIGDTIQVTKDKFIKQVSYDPTTHKLSITFVLADGSESTQEIDLSGLVDVYTAGDGINITNGVIKGVVDGNSESFLTLGANGFKLNGVQSAIDTSAATLQAVIDTVSGNVIAETTRATGIEDGLRTDVDTVSGNVIAETTRATGIEDGLRTDVDTVSGNVIAETNRATGIEDGLRSDVDTVSGSVITLAGVVDTVSGNVIAEETRAVGVETVLSGKIDTLNGDDTTEGSVAKSIKDAIEGLDVEEIGGTGKVITTVSETDGKISATAIDLTAQNVARTATTGLSSVTVAGALAELESYLSWQ